MGLGTEENNKKLQLFEQKWQQKWQHRQVPENCLLVMALEAEALGLVGYASIVLEMQRKVNSEPSKAEPLDVAPKDVAPKDVAPIEPLMQWLLRCYN